MKQQQLIIFILLFVGFNLNAQNNAIRVDVENCEVIEVLTELQEKYDLQFSYSTNQLKGHVISLSATFNTPQQAIEALFAKLPFKIEKSDDVFIVVPIKAKSSNSQKEKLITISGQIVEAGTLEPLPYSSVQINNYSLISNIMGGINYSFPQVEDSSVHIQISHLGYYVFDTVLFASTNNQFVLIPSNYDIAEVSITNSVVEKSTQFGESLAKINLNQNISGYFPSQGDNAVFNILRLMPGIQAAGEQTAEPLAWGSYEGQSRILFDGFLLFGLKNYNDNISAVNPLLVKRIEVFKSSYDARYNNSIGGIISIIGKNGNLTKPAIVLNVNPTTINGIAELPIGGESSLLLAYRQTYYNLYKSDDFNIFEPTTVFSGKKKQNNLTTSTDFSIYPDKYNFRDFNLKYSYNLRKGDLFYISLYRGGDDFSLETDAEVIMNRINGKGNGPNKNEQSDTNTFNLYSKEESSQSGLSVFYGKNWQSGISSNFMVARSGFEKRIGDELETTVPSAQRQQNYDSISFNNHATEFSFKNENILNYANANKLGFGFNFYSCNTSYVNAFIRNDSLINDTISSSGHHRVGAYLFNTFNVSEKFIIDIGTHVSYLSLPGKFYLEPRASTTYKMANSIKASVSWGMYNQYLFKQELVDLNRNYTYHWVAANSNVPSLKAIHYAAGIKFFQNNFTVNVEAYRKNMFNLSRRISIETVSAETGPGQPEISEDVYSGKAKAVGVEVLVKKDWKKHTIWASYLLSKTVESFDNTTAFEMDEFTTSPLDQRHEFKMAGLSNFGKWFISTSYVYGSGVQVLKSAFPSEDVRYNRLDAAVTYRVITRKLRIETGLSVLNVLNTKNLKYSNLKSVSVSNQFETITIHANAVTFTPILFVKLVY